MLIGFRFFIMASKTNESTRSKNARKHAVQLGSNRNNTGTGKKRKNSELDDAIQRQRNFLNGFIKKDWYLVGY